jgi:hypothetical protein
MPSFQNAPALLISLVVHVALLAIMAAFKLSIIDQKPQVEVQTVFSEQREQEEFTQELDVDTTVSENLSVTAGGVQSTHVGAASTAVAAKTKIEQSDKLQDPQFKYNIGDITTPGLATIGSDLGEGEVSGEVGAHVDGYGAAMSRLTQELIRMMRTQQVIAVWLFDESNSLKDDRKEISEQFHKVYAELGIANEEASKGRFGKFNSLETMVYGFGEHLHPITSKPTADIKEIQAAIDKVANDESGIENTFTAVSKVIDEHGRQAARSDRKLAIIILTDETGEDAEMLEEVITKAKRFKSPVYILGREAIFGYPYAHVRWVNPETSLTHWIRVDRGPETAFPELLQYDGFRGRWDSYSSGFGPYAQVRLVRESGGIYFLLAGDEADLAGRSVNRLQRRFDPIAMKEYEPLLLEKREYAKQRDASDFRKAIWEVILTLNPHIDDQLNIRWHHYPLTNAEFREEGKKQFDRAVRAMAINNQQIAKLERIKPLRAKEASQRWRAAFDLTYAQLCAQRIREFQYLLRMDEHVKNDPKPADPKHNYWDLTYSAQMLEPDAEQVKRTKVDMAELEAQRKKALELYEDVIREHPDTPWAMVAAEEKRLGFGMAFHSRFWDPRYFETERGKVPKF